MSKLKLIAFVSSVAATLTVIPTHASPMTPTYAANNWHVGVSALYLRPNFGGNGLGYSSFTNYGTDFFNRRIEVNGAPNHLHNIAPKRDWGFLLEAGYTCAEGNDIKLNWYHQHESNSRYLPTGSLFSGSASALYAGKIKVNPQWDAINLEFGHGFELGAMSALRLHAGLQYSIIKNTITNYPQLQPVSDPIFVTKDSIKYTGFGPRFGGDYLYQTCYGLGLYAKAAGSLLVGKAKQSVNGYFNLGGFNLYSTGNYQQSTNNVVVPELEAHFGVKYDYKIHQGNLGFDLGYMFVTYLGAIVSQVGAGVVSSAISTSSSTNFNLNGPYLGVTWTG